MQFHSVLLSQRFCSIELSGGQSHKSRDYTEEKEMTKCTHTHTHLLTYTLSHVHTQKFTYTLSQPLFYTAATVYHVCIVTVTIHTYIHTVHTISIGPTNQCPRTLANPGYLHCVPPSTSPSFTLLLLSVHHICIVTLSTCTVPCESIRPP